ncbi:uncharacterized protein LOC129305512 [Prosopis cineraria]|uniref:uncharacterized protein LOC129305512 n=1 Tax=Prosopis cineraria TaxID=364024 RepID=UPI00240F5F14|nr:uncharacterized protein LOC129305512 [Prosopis cineraria]
MTQEEAKASLNLIKGIIFFYVTRIEALFGSRVRHSFIVEECVDKLKLELKELPVLIKVITPSGSSNTTSKICQKVEIVFEDRVSVMDLICIPIKGIDVIVDMDWLAANNATLDCAMKLMSLSVLTVGTGSTNQARFLLVVQVEKLIKKGCCGYMVIFAISNVYDGGIEKIRVVSEFPEGLVHRIYVRGNTLRPRIVE